MRIFLIYFTLLAFLAQTACGSISVVFNGKGGKSYSSKSKAKRVAQAKKKKHKKKRKKYQARKSKRKSHRKSKRRRVVKVPRHYDKAKAIRGYFYWPHPGRLTSRFGPRWGRMHEGIDLSAKKGTSVRASAAGRVVYAGWLGGYGKLVLIKHKKGFFTAYGHNSKIKTRKGRRVRRGQVIAKAGSTGRSTGPHVHFEIRKGKTPQNPLRFLPKRRSSKKKRR